MLTVGHTVWVPVVVEDLHDRGNVVISCCGRRLTVHGADLETFLSPSIADAKPTEPAPGA